MNFSHIGGYASINLANGEFRQRSHGFDDFLKGRSAGNVSHYQSVKHALA